MADKKVKDLYSKLDRIKIKNYESLDWMKDTIENIRGINIETESYSSLTYESRNFRTSNVSRYSDTKKEFEQSLINGLEHYASFISQLAKELKNSGFHQKRNVIGRGLTRLYWYNVHKRCEEVANAKTWYQKWLAIGVVSVHLAFLFTNKPNLFIVDMVRKKASKKYAAISMAFRLLSHTTREYLKNKSKKYNKKTTENKSDPAIENNVNFFPIAIDWVSKLNLGLKELYENLRLWVSYTVRDKNTQIQEWNRLLKIPLDVT